MAGGGIMGGRQGAGSTSSQTQQPSYQMPASQGIPDNVVNLVGDAYSRILGRPADAVGATGWQDQMANRGLTGQQLVSGFVNSPEFQRQQQYEQAYTQQFRPGPTGRPFNPNQAAAPTTGPGGEALTTVDGKQGYYRQATGDEVRRSRGSSSGQGAVLDAIYGINNQKVNQKVEGYDPRTRQVFVPYSPQAGGSGQNTQSQQFFQPIYLSRYQNYQPEGFQGPFGGQMNPYGGFNPFTGFGGMGGMYGGGRMYAYAKGGDVDTGIAGLLE